MFWNADMMANSEIDSLPSRELQIQKQMHAVYTTHTGSVKDEWFTTLNTESLDHLKRFYEMVLKRLYTNDFHDTKWWGLSRTFFSTFMKIDKSRHLAIKEELLCCGCIINDLITAEKPREEVRKNCIFTGAILPRS
jgi:hypothetical protein